MGSAEERAGKDDEAKRTRRRRMGCIGWGIGIGLLVGVVVFAGHRWSSTTRGNYAICVKCMQCVRIEKRYIFGIRVSREVTPQQRITGGGKGTFGFDPPDPASRPAVYEDIHGCACNHHFVRGAMWCTYRGFRGEEHGHGGFLEWRLARPRIETMDALFAAFVRTGDRDTAKGVYELIDAYPVLVRGVYGLRAAYEVYVRARGDDCVLLRWEEGRALPEDAYSGCVGLDATALTLAEMSWRLKSVETSADFRQVLDDFKPRLKPALAEE